MQAFTFRPEQQSVAVDLTLEYARALEQAGSAFSAWAGPVLIASAGVIEFWPGRSQVWAMMSDQMPRYGALIHRYVKRYLDHHPVRRLECVVDPQFQKSVEWAKRLEFEFESVMKAYGFHGQDMHMYVRHHG